MPYDTKRPPGPGKDQGVNNLVSLGGADGSELNFPTVNHQTDVYTASRLAPNVIRFPHSRDALARHHWERYATALRAYWLSRSPIAAQEAQAAFDRFTHVFCPEGANNLTLALPTERRP